jgi:hypothetical protein
VPVRTVCSMDQSMFALAGASAPDPYARGLPQFLTIVDSDALLSSIDNHCRTNRPSRIARLARSYRVKVLAPDHVYGEVYAGFAKMAKSSPCSAGQLRSLFEQAYLPHLRWVTVDSAGAAPDDRIQAVLDIDGTDAPTAQLACLIGHCLVLSGDKSLRTPGFAPQEWRPAAGSAVMVATAGANSEGAASAMGLPLVGAVAGTVKFGNRIGLPWFMSIALMVGGVTLTFRDPCRRTRVWSRVGPVVEGILEHLAEEQRKAEVGRVGLTRSMFTTTGPHAAKQMVTIVLARASEPLLASDIRELIIDHFVEVTVPSIRQVRTILLAGSEFTQPERYRWQLGRHAGPWRGTG